MARTADVFYRVGRAGAPLLSDGGGPFGFDITVALFVDDLVEAYGCDAVVETGCLRGDTTLYLARRYPQLPVWSCDVDAPHAGFTAHRLAGHDNVMVTQEDSPDLVARASESHDLPLFFLDAHWGPSWPLARELEAVRRGVVVIHDFDVGHPRFSFDSYDGVACGPQVLADMPRPPLAYFTPDPDADHPLPCLQTGRRAGTGIIAVDLSTGALERHLRLKTRLLRATAEAS